MIRILLEIHGVGLAKTKIGLTLIFRKEVFLIYIQLLNLIYLFGIFIGKDIFLSTVYNIYFIIFILSSIY